MKISTGCIEDSKAANLTGNSNENKIVLPVLSSGDELKEVTETSHPQSAEVYVALKTFYDRDAAWQRVLDSFEAKDAAVAGKKRLSSVSGYSLPRILGSSIQKVYRYFFKTHRFTS